MFQSKRLITRIKKIDEDELNNLKKRIDSVNWVVIGFIAILISRLWFLQIHLGDTYEKLADSNRVRALDIIAPRGNLLDRHDQGIVANRPCFNLVWNKEDAPDPDEVIKRLARILDEDIAVLLARVRQAADDPRHIPIRLKEDLDWKVLAFIENNRLELPGVSIEVLPRRQYLFGNLASHAIGYIGEVSTEELAERQQDNYRPGDPIGKAGLERIFESALRGEKGRTFVEVDAHGLEQRRLEDLQPLAGNDLRLTLDVGLQQTAEEALAGRAGAVAAMEVDTGRVLALTSAPALNLEDFVGGIKTAVWQRLRNDPLHPLVDKSIMGQYPPGSTFKIVTALAGLSEKVITPDTTFSCSGALQFGNRSYSCWRHGGHGAVSLRRALAESCDVYFYTVGQRVGVDLLAKYARSLGLDAKTGIELINEKSGLIPDSDWKKKRYNEQWHAGETLSCAIGQGYVTATPLQLCRMIAAVANGGTLYQPQLIDTILDQQGKVLRGFTPVVAGHALGSGNSLMLIRDALTAAVNEPHGTGSAARVENITVAGKTGTAQVIRLARFKGMDEDEIPYKYRDHAWFICFAPAERPRIAVAALVEHGSHGGSAAAPIAQKVLSKYFEANN